MTDKKKPFPTGVSGPAFGTDPYRKGDYARAYFERMNKNKKPKKPKVKKIDLAKGDLVDFGMLSVKAGIDKNPNPTKADRIAGAKMKKPQGAFLGKIFKNPKFTEMFARIKGDQAIKNPEAYRQAYNKYATAYGNEPMKNPDNQKNQENQKPQVMAKDGQFVEDHSRGGRRAIRGTKFKGVF